MIQILNSGLVSVAIVITLILVIAYKFSIFINSLEKFQTYITNKVTAKGGDDLPDVLGGLNAAITEMMWSNATRVLIHIDCATTWPSFTNLNDDYPDCDPYGLTAE
ncbi:14987_t:CDS:1, partial [Dentiscutata heterogama]